MRIIGHRGAAGSELENTLASLQMAIDYDVYALEVDIRRTKDNHLVVCHDADLKRVANDRRQINHLTLSQLQKIPLLNGSGVPTLDEVLDLIGKKHLFIELKESGCAKLLIKTLSKYPNARLKVVSFKPSELAKVHKLSPNLQLYVLERTRPLEVIQLAKKQHLDGIGLNFWLLNPLTYWLCKRAGLDLYVFTVNRPFHARFLSRLYPDISICTDYPERYLAKS